MNTGEIFVLNTKDKGRSFLFSNTSISQSWAQDHMGRGLQNIIFRLFLNMTSIQCMSVPALFHLRVSRSSMPERGMSLLLYQDPRDFLSLEVQQKFPDTVWWRGTPVSIRLASALPAFIYLSTHSLFNDVFNCWGYTRYRMVSEWWTRKHLDGNSVRGIISWLPESWESKINWWVPWDLEPRITVLARTSCNLPNPTRTPLNNGFIQQQMNIKSNERYEIATKVF
jgi:hypothetical protein